MSEIVELVEEIIRTEEYPPRHKLRYTLPRGTMYDGDWRCVPETCDVVVEACLRVTQKGALIVVDGKDHWLPLKAIVSPNPYVATGEAHEAEIQLWALRFAKVKEYI